MPADKLWCTRLFTLSPGLWICPGDCPARVIVTHSFAPLHINKEAFAENSGRPHVCWCRDIIARFGNDPSYSLPAGFYDDFVRVRLIMAPQLDGFLGQGRLDGFRCCTYRLQRMSAGTMSC